MVIGHPHVLQSYRVVSAVARFFYAWQLPVWQAAFRSADRFCTWSWEPDKVLLRAASLGNWILIREEETGVRTFPAKRKPKRYFHDCVAQSPRVSTSIWKKNRAGWSRPQAAEGQ